MIRWRRLTAVVVLLVLGPVVFADPTPAPSPATSEAVARDRKLLAEAEKGSEIMANLTYLSDVIGPRLTGSAALKQANDWTAAKMTSYGLSNVHLEGWTIPVGWERGPATLRLVEPERKRPLTVASWGWSPGTKGRLVGDVVIVKARNSADLAPYKGKLKGAIVLRNAPTRIRPVADANLFDGPPQAGRRQGRGSQGSGSRPDARPGQKAEAARPDPGRQDRQRFQQMMGFRRELEEFLRSEGAAVILTDAGKPHGLLNMTGGWRGNDRVSGGDSIPALFVAHEHYALLYRLASRPAPARTRVEVQIDNKLIPGPIPVYNTVGEIRGSEKPDEIVVVGAHLDSWDLGQGTTDNGTGTAVVLEAARILSHSGITPRRTIRFILFTGEEQGLHGSRAYVQQHKNELPHMSMALVHDMGTGRVLGFYLMGHEAVKPILERELVSLKPLGVTDFTLRSMGGSDHASFDRAGVPGFAVVQDPAEYRFSHHSQSDTLDKAREPDLIQGAEVMAVTALRVANLPGLLPREKAAPQRTARDDGPKPAPAEKAPALRK